MLKHCLRLFRFRSLSQRQYILNPCREDVIFRDLGVMIHSAYFSIVTGDQGEPKAVLVMESPQPVMNYVIENKASSYLLLYSADGSSVCKMYGANFGFEAL